MEIYTEYIIRILEVMDNKVSSLLTERKNET